MYAGAALLDGVQDVKHAQEGRLYVDQAADRGRPRSCAERTPTRPVMAGMAAFDHDGCQHAKAIAESVEVAYTMDPGMLKAGNFRDAQALLRHSHMNQCLDLEAVAPQHPITLG